MALTIDNPELEKLVQELAQETGLTAEQALESAVRVRLREKQGIPRDPVVEEIREGALKEPPLNPEKVRALVEQIQKRVAQLPVLDSRSPDEILGYDEFGLPH
jgi:antitoxin VapB